MKAETGKSTKHGQPSLASLRRLKKARKDYKEIWKDVEPFVRKRPINPHSTVGEWLSLNYGP